MGAVYWGRYVTMVDPINRDNPAESTSPSIEKADGVVPLGYRSVFDERVEPTGGRVLGGVVSALLGLGASLLGVFALWIGSSPSFGWLDHMATAAIVAFCLFATYVACQRAVRCFRGDSPRMWSLPPWIVIACAVVMLLAVFRIHHSWRRSGNAPWYYPGRVGANDAMYDVREAAVAYLDANSGRLPATIMELKPYLPDVHERFYPVTADRLLPHVVMVTPAPVATTYPTRGQGRFCLMVYVLNPLGVNMTLIATDGQYVDEYCRDQDVIDVFGQQRLQQLKASAYQLP